MSKEQSIFCSRCGIRILKSTYMKNDGVCVPCSRKKGLFERDKHDGFWRLIDDSSSPIPYALFGTKDSWYPEAKSLADKIVCTNLKYINIGIKHIEEYIDTKRISSSVSWEVWEVRFLNDMCFEIIYELDRDYEALWKVSFMKVSSIEELYLPISFTKELR